MKPTLLLLLTTTIVLLGACHKDHLHLGQSNSEYMDATDCTGQTPTYTADVAPILNTHCALSGCHTALTPSHGLNLDGYQAAKNNFNLHQLLCAINHGDDCNPMPRNQPKLDDASILAITCWAKNGFPQ